MKNLLALAMLSLAFAAVSLDADAAKRFGGGNNIGKQRATPSNTAPAAPGNTATSAAPGGTAAPSTPAAPAPAAALPRCGCGRPAWRTLPKF